MAMLGAIGSIFGSVMSAAGSIAAGKAQQAAANYEAQQLKIKAKEEQAAAQRDAEQQTREKDLTLSKVQSTAAGSGFSATDPTTLDIIGDIEGYGDYKAKMAQYGGTSRRAGYESKAEAKIMEGQAARKAASINAASSIIGGFTGGLSKFNPLAGSSGGGGYNFG